MSEGIEAILKPTDNTGRRGVVRKRSSDTETENKRGKQSSDPVLRNKQSNMAHCSSSDSTPTDEASLIRAITSSSVLDKIAEALGASLIEKINTANSILIESSTRELRGTIDALLKENKAIKEENQIQKSRVNELEERVDTLEQERRGANLIVEGIQTDDSTGAELTHKITNQLAKAMKTEIKVEHVKYAAKLTSNQGKSRVRIVFNDRETRDIINKQRANLKGTDIWINEDLTMNRSKLAYLARKALKDKLITHTWVRNGEVYIRKHDEQKPKRLTHADEITGHNPT